MKTESITWTPVAARLPDADTTVLIALDDSHSEPTFLGFLGEHGWHDVNGQPIDGVIAWADMPAGVREADNELVHTAAGCQWTRGCAMSCCPEKKGAVGVALPREPEPKGGA